MMHLCFIYNQQLQEIELTDSQVELFTPLSRWEPAQSEAGWLKLPSNWSFSHQGGAPTSFVPLDREANYSLTNGETNALLMVRQGGGEAIKSETLLMKERFSVGRSRSNELCCRDGFLSSFHGVFSYDLEGALWYEDESTNGTFVNGKLVCGKKIRLHTGDQLDFPPQMRVVIEGSVLHVRYPHEHALMNLPKLPVNEAGIHTALYLRPTGRLYHLHLPLNTNTLQAFISNAAAQLDEKAAEYLLPNITLHEAETQTLISDNDILVSVLSSGSPVLLAT